MTSIPKALTHGLDIRLNTRLVSVSREQVGWRALDENGRLYYAQALILTPPVPQSLVLMDAGGTLLPGQARQALEAIRYHACIAGMLLLEQSSGLPEPGAVRFQRGPIRWIADNRLKGISPVHGLTIHTSSEFSRENWSNDPEHIAAELMQLASRWTGGAVRDWQVHRWRYSRPQSTYPEPFLRLGEEFPLLLCGDGFGGARVEAAALSGLAAAEVILGGRS